MIHKELLDKLRYESEGAALDFKRTQYHMLSGDDDKKSELLKDILAMANAWRQSEGPAYILLGFQDRSPNPAEVVGLDVNVDDAKMQQFIGSKVKPKLDFTYEELEYDGKHVGVIVIPKQQRPFYVAKSYGKVHSNIVYVRRGSSTAEADPVEVASMRDMELGRTASSAVSFRLFDEDGRALDAAYGKKRIAYDFGDIDSLPDLTVPRTSFMALTLGNPSYWRQLARYLLEQHGGVLVRFELQNASAFALNHCKLEVTVTLHGEDVRTLQNFKFNSRPDPDYAISGMRSIHEQLQDVQKAKVLGLEAVSGRETAVWRMDKLLPSEHLTCPHALALFPRKAGRLDIHARFLAADQAPMEMRSSLEVDTKLQVADFAALRLIDEQLPPRGRA